MDLVIPRGTRLFHGTLEEFDPARLTVGGYDSVLWTTDSPCIAQSYIGCSGLGVIVSAENFNRPSQDLHIQAIQKRIGVDYEYGTARGPTFSDDGRPTAWFPPKGIDREVLNDFWASKKEIRRRILEAGWRPMRSGSDIFEFEFSDGQLLEPGKCAEGRLFIITVEQDLKVYDMTDGGEREGDLMDVDYHKLDVFREAERRGYDGLRINDYAQSKIWGNFGHTSIGVFKGSLGKLSWATIPAQNFDWPDYETLRRGMTPEYEAWLKAEKTRANPPTLDLSRLTVRVCKGADRSHRESRRAYAHTFCRTGPTVCVASEFFNLPPGHRDGVLAHEVGHLLAGPEAGEESADRAFEEATGVRIRYKDGPHGRALQWLPADSRKSLLGVFEFDFEGHVSDAPGPDGDAVRFFVKDVDGKRELGSLREAERAAAEDPEADVWASEGHRRLGWRPMARNPEGDCEPCFRGSLSSGRTPTDFDQRELARGVEEELFHHGSDASVAARIAMDHLSLDPEYYARHDRLRAEAEEDAHRKAMKDDPAYRARAREWEAAQKKAEAAERSEKRSSSAYHYQQWLRHHPVYGKGSPFEGLRVRAVKALEAFGAKTISDVSEMTPCWIVLVKGIGWTTIDELHRFLRSHGRSFARCDCDLCVDFARHVARHDEIAAFHEKREKAGLEPPSLPRYPEDDAEA